MNIFDRPKGASNNGWWRYPYKEKGSGKLLPPSEDTPINFLTVDNPFLMQVHTTLESRPEPVTYLSTVTMAGEEFTIDDNF